MKKQSGFAALEIVLLVVVVAVIGFTVYTYMGNRRAATDTTTQEAATATVPAAPQVSSTTDLTVAENVVDQMDMDVSSADSAQLDSELTNF